MDRYVMSNGKRLRCGITTGTCAAAAAAAAVRLLLSGCAPVSVRVDLPSDGSVEVPVETAELDRGMARCGIRKDAGDDPDITNGLLIVSEVRLTGNGQISIDGGEGIGRVTLPGLDQPVGAAAINSVPRRMIEQAVRAELEVYDDPRGVDVLVSIPGGREAAEKTFNPRLGIVGGLSVLGTSGIVEPMSERAISDTVRAELSVRRARGRKTVMLTPGNYGRDHLMRIASLPDEAVIRCSNFIGESLDAAAELGFERIILAGHLGKLIKLSGNMFNTHSRYGDCRLELLAAHAAARGISAATAAALLEAPTVDRGLDLIDHECGCEAVLHGIMKRIRANVRRRLGRDISVMLFTIARGTLLCSEDYGTDFEAFLREEGTWYTSSERDPVPLT